MPGDSGDPRDIRSLAVTAEELVAAVETNRTTGREAVLRVTPPFSGRMRARLHIVQDGSAGTPRPVHVDPAALLEPDAPSYPRPAETEERLRADPDESYTVERHHDRHAEAVADWREALPAAVRNRATIETPLGPTDVTVYVLDAD